MSRSFIKGMVSVVVASYNHEKYLTKRMDSLLSQTYENIEIIVIDDRSPDNSVDVLRSYTSDSRIRLIEREVNGGWVNVSNQGVSLAKGEYIIFANCDDYCDSRMIESLVKGIRTSDNTGVAFCRSEMVDSDNVVIGDDFTVRERSFRERCKTDTSICADEICRFFLHSCVIPNLSAALIKRECLNSVGLFSDCYKACCDWDLFFRIFSKYDAYYVVAPLNSFRQHNKTIRSALKGRIEYEEFFRLLLSQIADNSKLNFFEKTKYRIHVMKLWCIHLLSRVQPGYKNFGYHFGVIYKYDKTALLFFLPAVLLRGAELSDKLLKKIFSK